MTIFYNVTFKIEASWANKVLKPIMETWNASDVIVYKTKNIQCKK